MLDLLDIINSVAVFQLVFFTIYLFIKGNRIPSTFFLKIHLIFQIVSYANYMYFLKGIQIIKPLLLISVPSIFIWAPTFYLYIRSRLYIKFAPSLKLLIHSLPAIIIIIYVSIIFIHGEFFHDRISRFGNQLYYASKIQLLIYNIYTLFIIYKYQSSLKYHTSASEKQKLSWLFIITYGFTLNSLVGFILNLLTNYSVMMWEYLFFLIFINIFFFKAIIQPDQFLGIDDSKIMPVRLDVNKSKTCFHKIEEAINSNQLFLDPELSLHNVSQAVKFSDRYVSQAIKQNVNLNFADYINIKRIEYAKEILRSTTKAEKNVLEILYESGFNSKSVFNSQFKKHTGLSPTDYRKVN